MKIVFLFLFLSLISCSLNDKSDFWNKSLNLEKENLDYDKNYSIAEYEKILKGYNDKTDYPDIN